MNSAVHYGNEEQRMARTRRAVESIAAVEAERERDRVTVAKAWRDVILSTPGMENGVDVEKKFNPAELRGPGGKWIHMGTGGKTAKHLTAEHGIDPDTAKRVIRHANNPGGPGNSFAKSSSGKIVHVRRVSEPGKPGRFDVTTSDSIRDEPWRSLEIQAQHRAEIDTLKPHQLPVYDNMRESGRTHGQALGAARMRVSPEERAARPPATMDEKKNAEFNARSASIHRQADELPAGPNSARAAELMHDAANRLSTGAPEQAPARLKSAADLLSDDGNDADARVIRGHARLIRQRMKQEAAGLIRYE